MEEFKNLKQIVDYLESCFYVYIKAPPRAPFFSTMLIDDPAFKKLKEISEREHKNSIPLKIRLRYDVVFDIYKHVEKFHCVVREGTVGDYSPTDGGCYCFQTECKNHVYYDKDFVTFHKEMFEEMI